VNRLTAPDGWLTLVGLHFLQPGANTVGRAPDNQIVLTGGPAHFGTVHQAVGGKSTFTPAAESNALVDGHPAREAELKPGGTNKRPWSPRGRSASS